jgi:hypothetical protein
VESNVTFSLKNITLNETSYYTIPSGYYNVNTFKEYLSILLGSQWTINYSSSTNTYTIIPPFNSNIYTLSFINSGHLFGFDNITTQEFNNLHPITSTKPILMNIDNSLFIRTDIPRKRNGAVDNLLTPHFNESDILCTVPMIFGPFNNLSIDCSNQFVFYLSVKELHKFRLYITDQYSNPVPIKYDYTIALKFEFIETEIHDETLNTLKEIRDLLKYVTLHKFIN